MDSLIVHLLLNKDEMLKLIAVCHWHLYSVIYVLDHADLVLQNPEAEEPG